MYLTCSTEEPRPRLLNSLLLPGISARLLGRESGKKPKPCTRRAQADPRQDQLLPQLVWVWAQGPLPFFFQSPENPP